MNYGKSKIFNFVLFAFVLFFCGQLKVQASILYENTEQNYHTNDFIGTTIGVASTTFGYNVPFTLGSTVYTYLPKTATTTCSSVYLTAMSSNGRTDWGGADFGTLINSNACEFVLTYSQNVNVTGGIQFFLINATELSSFDSPTNYNDTYYDSKIGGDISHFQPTIIISDTQISTPAFATSTGTTTPTTDIGFTSINVSTSTNKVNLTGYWETGNRISFFTDSSLYGGNNFDTKTATSTGLFNLYFDYVPVSPLTISTSTPNIITDMNFYAVLEDMTPTTPLQLDSITTTIYNTDIGVSLASTTGILNYPEPSDCGITNIGGCIKNAIVWAFFPSQETLNLFTSLRQYILVKAPIGYFVRVQNGLTGLSASSTKAFDITIPVHIKETFINPIDIGLSSILWFYFIINFYRRLKHIQI